MFGLGLMWALILVPSPTTRLDLDLDLVALDDLHEAAALWLQIAQSPHPRHRGEGRHQAGTPLLPDSGFRRVAHDIACSSSCLPDYSRRNTRISSPARLWLLSAMPCLLQQAHLAVNKNAPFLVVDDHNWGISYAAPEYQPCHTVYNPSGLHEWPWRSPFLIFITNK